MFRSDSSSSCHGLAAERDQADAVVLALLDEAPDDLLGRAQPVLRAHVFRQHRLRRVYGHHDGDPLPLVLHHGGARPRPGEGDHQPGEGARAHGVGKDAQEGAPPPAASSSAPARAKVSAAGRRRRIHHSQPGTSSRSSSAHGCAS
jgi:hypothetical protein